MTGKSVRGGSEIKKIKAMGLPAKSKEASAKSARAEDIANSKNKNILKRKEVS